MDCLPFSAPWRGMVIERIIGRGHSGVSLKCNVACQFLSTRFEGRSPRHACALARVGWAGQWLRLTFGLDAKGAAMGVKVKSRRQQAAPAPEVAPRRVPMQERARQRVDGILDAAAHVFDEVGDEAATTNAIAARARSPSAPSTSSSPTSRRCSTRSPRATRRGARAVPADTGPGVERLPLRDSLGQLIDAVVQLHRTRPGYRAMMQVARSTPVRIAGVDKLNALFHAASQSSWRCAPAPVPEIGDRRRRGGEYGGRADVARRQAERRVGRARGDADQAALERALSSIEEPAPRRAERDKQG